MMHDLYNLISERTVASNWKGIQKPHTTFWFLCYVLVWCINARYESSVFWFWLSVPCEIWGPLLSESLHWKTRSNCTLQATQYSRREHCKKAFISCCRPVRSFFLKWEIEMLESVQTGFTKIAFSKGFSRSIQSELWDPSAHFRLPSLNIAASGWEPLHTVLWSVNG